MSFLRPTDSSLANVSSFRDVLSAVAEQAFSLSCLHSRPEACSTALVSEPARRLELRTDFHFMRGLTRDTSGAHAVEIGKNGGGS
jgi:hypothetical protein